MPLLRAELHVHTVLSPCADIEMIPPLIVQQAVESGIQVIAITDHNATANIGAVRQAAAGCDLTVLPGVELQTAEEIHVLCLFDLLEQAEEFQKWIDAALPDMDNKIEFFGEQFVVDATGDFIRREERLLLTSTSMTLTKAWKNTVDLGGILIPAHVNRKAFGLLPVLGFVPTDTPLDILEISAQLSPAEALRKYPQVKGYPLIQNGDAHFLEDIRGLNEISVEKVTVKEIHSAILGREGRSHRLLSL